MPTETSYYLETVASESCLMLDYVCVINFRIIVIIIIIPQVVKKPGVKN